MQSEDDAAKRSIPPAPGRYHAVITNVDESLEKVDKVIVTFQVIAGNKEGQEGLEIAEFFPVKGKVINRLQRLALVTGLLKPDEEEREVEFSAAVGNDLIIEVEENEYEKDGQTKKNMRISYAGMWSVGNKEVKDVPMGRKEAAANKEEPPAQDYAQTGPTDSGWDNF
jgi:hypothetical protein